MSATSPNDAAKPESKAKIDLEQSEDHIRVVARFRPINAKEKHEEKMQNLSSEPISLYNNSSSVSVPRPNKPNIEFTLDDVIWTDSTQQQTFETLSKPLIDQVMKGYNCSIFAFGQTGSGKTYTMFGPDNYSRVEHLGIIPRSIDYLFSSLAEGKDIINFQVTLSVIEIYKEQTRDLLNTAKRRKRLEIFVSQQEVIVKNMIEITCKDVDEVLSHILKAQASRNTRTTDFIGHASSRSHCVVMVSVTQRLLDDTVKTSKMNFADLAGSELASRTGATGDTLKEAGKIHQGLLALENVINALVDKKKHVPYKDSNLTRVLKDSLGGNSKTTLLVACSPHIWNRAETVSTLRFAARAKKIKNKAKINQRRTRNQLEQRIRNLEDANKSLRKKVTKLKTQKHGAQTVENDGFTDEKLKEALNEIERLKELLRKKEDRIQQMEQDLKSKDDIIDEMNNKYTKKRKQLEQGIKERDHTIEELQSKVSANESQIQELTQQLQHDERLQVSFNDHNRRLSAMVKETISDETNATVAALSELQKQQKAFYLFMRSMQGNIDKIYNKQMDHDKALEEIQNKEFNVVHNHQIPSKRPWFGDVLSADEYEGNEDMGEDEIDDEELNQRRQMRMKHRLSTASIILPADINDAEDDKYARAKSNEALDNVVNSMTSYLERSRTGRVNLNELKKGANIAMEEENEKVIGVTESMTSDAEDAEDTKQQERKETGDYRIGTTIDILDSSYRWYSAQIVDIDVLHRKALQVHYDGFDDKWNEWIPLTKTQFRTALHKSKSQGAGKEEGGVHALIATRYGRSRVAGDLRLAFDPCADKSLSEVHVLLEGYAFKRGNFVKNWKKRWFVLDSSCNICYYESMHIARTVPKNYRGVIALVNIRKITAVAKGYTQYSFNIQTPTRVYNFSCLNQSELKDWMSVLECLMNCSLDDIAATKKNPQQMLGFDNINTTADIDPNRFKTKQTRGSRFYTLTTTPSPETGGGFEFNTTGDTKHRHKRSVSVIDRFKMKLTNSRKSVVEK